MNEIAMYMGYIMMILFAIISIIAIGCIIIETSISIFLKATNGTDKFFKWLKYERTKKLFSNIKET